MKYIISAIIFLAGMLSLPMYGQDAQAPSRPFDLPEIPEQLESLSDRTSFLVHHFWDKCHLNSAIRKPEQFKAAFKEYVDLMPYADATAVHESVENLINKFKNDPEHLLTLAGIARETLYDENAEFTSDEVFLPFAEAVASNKKIKSADKSEYARIASILNQSQEGKRAYDLQFTLPDGTRQKLSEVGQGYVLLFFNDLGNPDCALARVRLSADHNVNNLLNQGRLKIVCITPGEPNEEWRQKVSGYNPQWVVGAAPDAVDHFDMRNAPVFYYLSPSHSIRSKSLTIDGLLEAFRYAAVGLNQTANSNSDATSQEP